MTPSCRAPPSGFGVAWLMGDLHAVVCAFSIFFGTFLEFSTIGGFHLKQFRRAIDARIPTHLQQHNIPRRREPPLHDCIGDGGQPDIERSRNFFASERICYLEHICHDPLLSTVSGFCNIHKWWFASKSIVGEHRPYDRPPRLQRNWPTPTPDQNWVFGPFPKGLG